MTEQEQQWGRWLGLASAAGFAVLPQPWLGGQRLIQTGLGVSLGMLLWALSRQGHRIRTAVASYLFLFAFGDLFLLGAVHIAFSFLLAFRSSREMGRARAAERSLARQSKTTAEPARKKGDHAESGRAARVAEPNRRYTPPKTKTKRRR